MGLLEGEEQPPAPRALFNIPEMLGDALVGCVGRKRNGARAEQGSIAMPTSTGAVGMNPAAGWGWGGQAGRGQGGDRCSFLLARLGMLLLSLGKPGMASSPYLPELPSLGLFPGLSSPSPNPAAHPAAPA